MTLLSQPCTTLCILGIPSSLCDLSLSSPPVEDGKCRGFIVKIFPSTFPSDAYAPHKDNRILKGSIIDKLKLIFLLNLSRNKCFFWFS